MNFDWEPNPTARPAQTANEGDTVKLKLKVSNHFYYSVLAKVFKVNAENIDAQIVGITDWDDRVHLVADNVTTLIGTIVTFKPGYIHQTTP